jgi:hypothetical protein
MVTMRYPIRVTGFIVALALVLALAVGSAQARRARPGRSETTPVSTGDAERADDTAWVCLVLVGGVALLAVAAWIAKVRRLLS